LITKVEVKVMDVGIIVVIEAVVEVVVAVNMASGATRPLMGKIFLHEQKPSN
jgi:hypothetical protein